ncbi:MAG: patatin-like phospholipase family protein, partial [Polyangiales bacterium]
MLSGGGARGAYEVGVLSYLFNELPRLRGGRVPRIDILCGTSVGAINACYLAAHAGDPSHGISRLLDLWEGLEIGRVLGFGLRQAIGLPRLVLGGGEATGLFDVRPMSDLIEREVGWRAVTRNLRRGHLRALSISTTEVSTGRTVIWMQTAPDVSLPSTAPPRTLIRADHIGTRHALASAAIPLLFPPVQIGNDFYCDGGLRLNTPIAPALRLGATHVFAVALSKEVRGVVSPESGPTLPRPLGASALLGKVLNAFLLDHVVNDLDVLARINAMIEDGTRAFGDDFTERLSSIARARGGESYRPVNCLALKPTEDIGRIASDHVARGKFQGSAMVARQLFKLLYLGGDVEADLASYVMFDGGFCKRLIDLGRADAAARREEILEFFADDEGITDPGGSGRPSSASSSTGSSFSLDPAG